VIIRYDQAPGQTETGSFHVRFGTNKKDNRLYGIALSRSRRIKRPLNGGWNGIVGFIGFLSSGRQSSHTKK